MIATLRQDDLLLATRTLLVVLPFAQILKRILFQHLMTTVVLRAADITGPRPTPPAGAAATSQAANSSGAFGAQESAANNPVGAAAMFTVQAGLHRLGVFSQLLSPRVEEFPVEQVPERPDVHDHVSPFRWVVVFVLQGVVEARDHAVFGAFVADPAVVDQTGVCFELEVAAEHTVEVGLGHGGLVCASLSVVAGRDRGWRKSRGEVA